MGIYDKPKGGAAVLTPPAEPSSPADANPVPSTTPQTSPRGDDSPSPQNSPVAIPSVRVRIPRKELVGLTTQLAIMIRSGVDVATALKSVGKRSRRPAMRMMLEHICETVLSGNPLSEALRQHQHVFGETFVASVTAGEASGRLPEVLQQLAEMERSALRLRGSIRTMLAYPVMLCSVSSMVVAGLVFFVLPQFADIFAQFEMELPLVTCLLIAVADELSGRFWLWIPLFLTMLGAVVGFTYTSTGRRWWDWSLLNVLIIREVSRNLAIGRVCRLLGLMVESGVPLLDAIRLARTANKNSLYRRLFADIEDDVINGRGMGSALSTAMFIPGGAAEMLITAERTGSIGPVTEMIGGHYEEEGEQKLKEIVALLEPAITVGMGIVIAVIVSAVMLPMFDMSQINSH